jgi:TIGR03943 family protein
MYCKWLAWHVEHCGAIAMALLCAVVIRLGVLGKLQLYIHPRYTIFTLVMAGAGLIVALASIAVGYRSQHAVQTATCARGNRTVMKVITALLFVMACAGFLFVQPAALSSRTAVSRGIDRNPALTDASISQALFDTVDYSQLGIKDWSSLLAHYDANFFVGKTASITGFVADNGNTNIFFASRFFVTCCVVDAQPIGVPVYAPDWRYRYSPNSWLEITGEFIENPDTNSPHNIVLKPSRIQSVAPPREPYVY